MPIKIFPTFKKLLQTTILFPFLGCVFTSSPVLAEQEPVINISQLEDNSITNKTDVIPVSELSDVQPWALEALESLIEGYGCIDKNTDRQFRGDEPLTRYEFSALLTSCLQYFTDSQERGLEIASEDWTVIKRLQEDFAEELVFLGTRVDNLESRVNQIEERQFATTTKLNGLAVFSLEGVVGEHKANSNQPLDDSVTFSHWTALQLNTSFNGQDNLRIGLLASNVPDLTQATGTSFARRNYFGSTNNSLVVYQLWYSFPIGEKITAKIATSHYPIDSFDAFSSQPYAGDSFALANGLSPLIYWPSATFGGPGASVNIRFNDSIGLDLGYFTPKSASNPEAGQGLVGGSYSAGGQLNVNWGRDVTLALSYFHSHQNSKTGRYDLAGLTGSSEASDPFSLQANSTNNFSIQGNWRVSPSFNLGGFVGYSHGYTEEGGASADIWNWSAHVAFPDLGGEGNLLRMGFGMPPKLTASRGNNMEAPNSHTGYVFDAEYRYKVSNNLNVTFGGYAVFNPEHNVNNKPIYILRIRPMFFF